MPRRALTPAASAQPVAFTPKDEKKLKSAIGRFGRQWSTIHAEKHFSTYPLTIIKAKGLAIIKSSTESKDRVTKVKSTISKCEKLKFTRLLRKFSESRVKAYLRFLTLKAIEEDFDCEELSPSSEVDEVWHFHLLDTRHYRETCQELCGNGSFIDHDPDGGDDAEARDVRREYAAELEEEIGLSTDKPKLKDVPAPRAPVSHARAVPPAAQPVPPPHLSDASVNLKAVTQDGKELFMKCKLSTPLKKLMTAFCKRQGIAMSSVRFLFDGSRVSPNDTPWCIANSCSAAQPHMLDGDVIDVMVEQQGC